MNIISIKGEVLKARRNKKIKSVLRSRQDSMQLLFICRKTNYFSKKYFTNLAKYMMSLFLDIARESSKLIYKIRMLPLLFAV